MKSNLIKRQDAIDIVSFECGKWKGLAKEITKQINALPSAQPNACENTCDFERKSNDMISRQDAVSREAVSEWLKQYGQDVLHGKYKFSLMYIWKNLMDLPSVQPEKFEWCHDCKEYDQTQHYCPRWTKVIRRTVEELKAQSKTGKWIYDGDCYICNKCKSAFNWWADSQTSNYCPNCGARMKEGD